MVYDCRYQPFALVIQLIDVDIWRKCIGFQSIVYTDSNIFHISFRQPCKFVAFGCFAFIINTGQACSQKAQIFILHIAVRDTLQQFFECHHRSRHVIRSRTGYLHFVLCYANSINQIEQVFTIRIRRNIPQLFIPNRAHSAPLHLSIQRIRLDIAHKHDHFERLDIRTRSNQRYSNSNAEFLVIAELPYQFVAISGRIGNLLHEFVIVPTENLFCNFDDIACMSIVQRKNERFRQIVHIRFALWIDEHFGIYCIPIGFKNQLYLCRIDYAAIQLCFSICRFFARFYILNRAGISGYLFYFLPFTNCSSILGSLRFDSVYTIIHIYTIGDRFFERVVYNAVIIEECQCFRRRRSRQTDHFCRIEIIEHFSPTTIDRAMTLINDNHIEIVGRQSQIGRQCNIRHLIITIIFIVITVRNIISF